MDNDKNWGYENSKTPEPIITKFGVGDCIGDLTPHAKIQSSRPSGGVPANGWFLFFVTRIFARVPKLN